MKKGFSIFLCILTSIVVHATEIQEKLEEYLSPILIPELLVQNSLQKTAYKNKEQTVSLAPNSLLTKEAIEFWSGEDAPFFFEKVFLYKKLKNNQEFIVNNIENISILLRSISKLQGLEYYSTSRKKMRILYEESYVVDNEKSQKKIVDPITGNADRLSLIAIQKDLTFGKNVYNYLYRQDKNTVAFYSKNTSTINYSFLKVIDPGKLHVSLVVHDLGDYLLIYGLTRATFIAIPGLEEKLTASFSTRIDALYNWFIQEYEKL